MYRTAIKGFFLDLRKGAICITLPSRAIEWISPLKFRSHTTNLLILLDATSRSPFFLETTSIKRSRPGILLIWQSKEGSGLSLSRFQTLIIPFSDITAKAHILPSRHPFKIVTLPEPIGNLSRKRIGGSLLSPSISHTIIFS